MIFAFLDEFGHSGPYFSAHHPRFNTSPVFGLAGCLLPDHAVRNFASFFIQRKTELLAPEIERSGKNAYEWEKKGTNFFTARSIVRYPAVRNVMFRIIRHIDLKGGRLFYYGREKIREREGLNSNGLYKTVFSNAIRRIDHYCETVGENFVVVMDQNSVRRELLETAAKTMYGSAPARRMASPPFEVESHLNQNIQAADWIATIAGRLWSRELDPEGFAHLEPYARYFDARFHQNCVESEVMRRRPPIGIGRKA